MLKKDLRFEFGKNWENYSKAQNNKALMKAKKSLKNWIPFETLEGKSFLDIGSGSGLFSRAAWDLGAKDIFSFDYDENSVKCTQARCESVKKDEGRTWQVEQGNAIDDSYMSRFYDKYDVVYSWGVLHHTGNMEKGLSEAGKCVKWGGYLFISIYNDQGRVSKVWRFIKKRYNLSGNFGKQILILLSSLYLYGIKGTKYVYSQRSSNNCSNRGMNPWYDLVDWVGGYPFEVATPQKIITYYMNKGFTLKKLEAYDSNCSWCNQYLFQKDN